MARAIRPSALGFAALAVLARGGTPSPAETPPAAAWVGAKACAPCHPAQTERWRSSHHHLAMQPARSDTVRGRFDGARVTVDGAVTQLSRRGDRFVVHTAGPDGAPRDYPVVWTFGATPLQQYLLALPGGRLQAFRLAWDTRPAAAGGQRWFDLYPGEHIDHRDELHWSGPQQNWNFMCAECHSTNLRKGYRAAENRFATTWTDPDVSCEACHGPGALHVAWAERARRGEPDPDPGHGLTVALRDPSGGSWALAPGTSIAQRSGPRSRTEVETCGRCHVRAAQVWEDDPPGLPLAQTHLVALLEPGLYHPDGQIDGEVYEYGPFVQSRMYAAGVTCSDCHEPHAGGLRAMGNALCARCHAAATYDVVAHHHHEPGSAGAQCVSCHMPERLYMVVDGRRDHGFRVPRPDLSERLGTPNACTGCHRDRPAAWAAEHVTAWYGPTRGRSWHWGEALHAGRTLRADGERQLLRALDDRTVPPIARATAVSLLPPYLGPRSLDALARAARDDDPLVRAAAADAIAALPPPNRVALAAPLLDDPMRTVRLEALGGLLDVPPSALTEAQRASRDRVIGEYRRVQDYNADRAEAWANLGMLEARLGNAAGAETALETALRREPRWVPAHVELAELRRRRGDEAGAEATLRRALAAQPDVAALHAALGLSLVRQGRREEARAELTRAAALAPEVPRHAYVLAIAMHDGGDVRGALDVLRRAHERHPGARDVLLALAQYAAEAGDRAAALEWASRLAETSGDESARRMVEQLAQRP